MPTHTLDSVSDGFLAVLAPGGTPACGTLKTVMKRSPEVPIQEPTPALLFPPLSAPVEWNAITGHRKHWRGYIAMTYLDQVPAQQSAQSGTTVTLAAVEDALTANLEAIVAAIEANPKLGGAVNFCGAIPGAGGVGGEPIKVTPNPGGPLKDEFGTMWVAFTLTIPFLGNADTIP